MMSFEIMSRFQLSMKQICFHIAFETAVLFKAYLQMRCNGLFKDASAALDNIKDFVSYCGTTVSELGFSSAKKQCVALTNNPYLQRMKDKLSSYYFKYDETMMTYMNITSVRSSALLSQNLKGVYILLHQAH